MFWLLSKILVPVSSPFFWICTFALLALVLKNKRLKMIFISLVVFSLLFFSNCGIIKFLIRTWEIPFVKTETLMEKRFKYGIVLGGFAGFNDSDKTIEFNNSSDRINYAIMFYKQGVFEKFLISGGEGSLIKTGVSEAQVTFDYLVSIGIPREDIIIEGNSRNTIENVLFLKNSLHTTGSDCLLITSAYHMRRSLAIFQKQGLTPAHFSCDMRGSGLRSYDFVLFSADSFGLWNIYSHEVIGYCVYKIMGYC
jgi:uncharacterized SAM-binding protein YcdF (DUF218 family)